jgi:hypothetical protein
MNSKTQLLQSIQDTEAQLNKLKKQLVAHNFAPTLTEASVGDTLEDGSIVLEKQNGLALLVAPKNTEVVTSWSKEFPELYKKLTEEGFNSSQWFVPTYKQLELAYKTIPNSFSSTAYWSSTEYNATTACLVFFSNGNTSFNSKPYTSCVRAFRCANY